MATTSAAPPADIFRRSDELRALIAPHFVHSSVPRDKPIPTNAWWGNLLAWDGQRESDAIFSSPYTYKVVQGQPGTIGCGLSVSYLAQYRVDGPKNDNDAIRYYYYPPTIKNLLFSAQEFGVMNTAPPFTIDAWDDLGVVLTLAVGAAIMRTYLAVGSAFTTVQYDDLHVQLCSDHGWLTINNQPIREGQEYVGQNFVVTLNNGQKWILYFFPTHGISNQGTTIRFQNSKLTTTQKFNGIVQAAYVSNNPPDAESDTCILQLYHSTSGVFAKGATVLHNEADAFSFDWNLVIAAGAESNLFLHFALDHLRQMFDTSASGAVVNPELTLHSHTRGPVRAYATSTRSHKWVFRIPLPIHGSVERFTAFYPPHADLPATKVAALNLAGIVKDEIYGNWDQALPHEGSYYFKGKALQKFGTMCLVAKKLAETTNPELHSVAQHGIARLKTIMNAFVSNKSAYPLVYDTVYKGVISSEAFVKRDVNVDFGNAVYNDHHYHYGYLITATAMLMHLDPSWRNSADAVPVRSFIDTLIRDVINPADGEQYFPRFRNFNWFLGHSYSHGVTPMADGKDEESTSEEVNFFYGVALYSQITHNTQMETLAKLMLKVYTLAVNTYFLIDDANQIHPPAFRKNKITGIFFDNKCDYTTWFSPNKECIHGIQMIPVSPITQAVRSTKFVKEEWDQVLSKLPFVSDWRAHMSGWTSLLFANYAAIDSDLACHVLAQCPMDDGLSRAWALYIAATRAQNW
uniref:glucan endo-1,3-beta-D-glucosidase n=1 Tax=Globisporangium ultimum (strain ATCC 200006 / CBS 805.95 / DAOM BR144) TaxID=431595 RepID=K3WQ73_GLOUD